ncbi:hypothetical protein BU16DRAFT_462430 [Lophium mytilinum]|uniref:Putative gamma-glutamylcyclotransferase n=1 Tax=Lophium mytilinum TaxID=390894 RepID=A0A6A6QRQ6_9PEZI|nr:hypothetical protein BU16DRAFT_462430 [Lophium mytilinum]
MVTSRSRKREPTSGNVYYLVKLEPPFSTAEELAVAANLSPNNTPSVEKATGDEGTARFCRLSTHSKEILTDWLALKHPSYRPTFIRIGKASKELSSTSIYPTLGVDTTLPQHRPNAWHTSCPYPLQDQYPVWYFFYGTLANENLLSNLFGWSDDITDKMPILHRASVRGGVLKTWGGRYRAMVDSPGAVVEGFAYQVQSRDEEDALLLYETEKYEVVRCEITLDGAKTVIMRRVKGCTFRFAGCEEELD